MSPPSRCPCTGSPAHRCSCNTCAPSSASLRPAPRSPIPEIPAPASAPAHTPPSPQLQPALTPRPRSATPYWRNTYPPPLSFPRRPPSALLPPDTSPILAPPALYPPLNCPHLRLVPCRSSIPHPSIPPPPDSTHRNGSTNTSRPTYCRPALRLDFRKPYRSPG